MDIILNTKLQPMRTIIATCFSFSYVQVSKNIVMEAHLIRPAHFTGITCIAYQRRELSTGSLGMEITDSANEQLLHFRCSTGSHNTSLNNFLLKVMHQFVASVTTYCTISILL